MGQRIPSAVSGSLAILSAPVLVLGMTPASAASCLRAAIGASPGAPAAGYSGRAELTAADRAAGDQFGYTVALSASGTTALAGAPGLSGPGAAYVFTLRGGTWSQTAELTASRAAPNDASGSAVALSAPGTTALVGASGHSVTGAAFVFAGIR